MTIVAGAFGVVALLGAAGPAAAQCSGGGGGGGYRGGGYAGGRTFGHAIYGGTMGGGAGCMMMGGMSMGGMQMTAMPMPMQMPATATQQSTGGMQMTAMPMPTSDAQGSMAGVHAQPAPAAPAAQQYHCPMHPNVVSSGPAICPYCRMALQPR
jgi:hypothetical protein